MLKLVLFAIIVTIITSACGRSGYSSYLVNPTDACREFDVAGIQLFAGPSTSPTVVSFYDQCGGTLKASVAADGASMIVDAVKVTVTSIDGSAAMRLELKK